ncbi:cytochrome P450 [Flammula alnicola]|nr:cytochrome P450 [Flammula alnicola]
MVNSRDDISSLLGPESLSWIYGNLVEFVLGVPAGKAEMGWFRKYGSIFRFRACFGEDRLMISDPAAVKHIFSNPTLFVKSPSHQLINLVGFGTGSLLYAHGDDHRRIRAVMNPMFSASSVRALTPILEKIAQDLSDDWTTASGTVIDMFSSIHRTTLRAITEAVMGYDTTEDKEYTSSYEDLVVTAAQRSKTAIIADAIISRLPSSSTKFLMDHPPPDLRKFLDHRLIARKVSEKLLGTRLETLRLGNEPEKDLFSILVGQNEQMAVRIRMTKDEIKDQFGTITVAGEDTSANTLVWVSYVLAKNPKWQEIIRQEVNAKLASHPGMPLDYDRLPFLNAVIKEVLRFYATVSYTERVSSVDTVLPLSGPIVSSSGKTLTEVRIRKGRTVIISITTYNRLPSIWGEDADEFKPSRWLEGGEVAKGASIGPYANLLSFIGGPRTCIGWRFAILETQMITCELVRKFVLSLPENVSIQPASAITLVPMDSEGKTRLPLHIECLE